MDDLLNAVQWPAMLVTLAAAWLVGSRNTHKRGLGFLCFVSGNVLWVVWGWHTQAYALIALQVGLFVLNLRGAKKAETDS